jgi:crossover junction endodeoxyribonuclease RuvC
MISFYSMGKSSRQLWKDYLEGRSTGKPTSFANQETVRLEGYQGMILGIDPSLRGTGLAVVEFSDRGRLKLHHKETVKVPQKLSQMKCLSAISERCESIADAFGIHHVAVEQTIYVQNFRTAMTLGMAKGAALGVLAKGGYEVFEYPPLRIKQAVVGNGRASKEQVAEMVSSFLGFKEWTSSDETDAAGVALCHGFTHKTAS